MTIYFCYHIRLCMSGISLNYLDISTTQFQLVRYTGMTQTVKHYIRKSQFINDILHFISQITVSDRQPEGSCHYKIVVMILITQGSLYFILFLFQFYQILCNRSWNEHFSCTTFRLWCLQYPYRLIILFL